MCKYIGKGDDAYEELINSVVIMFSVCHHDIKNIAVYASEVTDESTRPYTYEQFYEMAGLDNYSLTIPPMESVDHFDENGCLCGGYVEGAGMALRWQDGPVDTIDGSPWNGCMVLSVLKAVSERVKSLTHTQPWVDGEVSHKLEEVMYLIEQKYRSVFKATGRIGEVFYGSS